MLALIGVDMFKLMLMMLGAIVYWSAHKLSRNPLFYYLCGIALGITTSVIVLVYIFSKLLPRVSYLYDVCFKNCFTHG